LAEIVRADGTELGGEFGFEIGDDGGEFRFFGEVGVLLGVALHVEELDAG
jgi:hypothetical protein